MDCRDMCGLCHTSHSLFIAFHQAVQSGTGIETHVQYFQLVPGWRRVRFPLLRREGRKGGNRAVRGWKVLHMGFNSSATLHSLRIRYGKAVTSVTYTAHVPTVHLLGHSWSEQGVSFGATQVAWLRHHHYLVRRTSPCSVRWLRLRHPLTYP